MKIPGGVLLFYYLAINILSFGTEAFRFLTTNNNVKEVTKRIRRNSYGNNANAIRISGRSSLQTSLFSYVNSLNNWELSSTSPSGGTNDFYGNIARDHYDLEAALVQAQENFTSAGGLERTCKHLKRMKGKDSQVARAVSLALQAEKFNIMAKCKSRPKQYSLAMYREKRRYLDAMVVIAKHEDWCYGWQLAHEDHPYCWLAFKMGSKFKWLTWHVPIDHIETKQHLRLPDSEPVTGRKWRNVFGNAKGHKLAQLQKIATKLMK
mmetsp:Transcript_16544/g.19069  ORF Transcript_16544/g.19069 Transcript_16544/m.19069 type:complete len:264 (-) Transcript_16544:24-815(-)